MSAEARTNCWAVSRRNVYRMSTFVFIWFFSPARTDLRRSQRMVNAARPRYASVLPPPVGIQITSTFWRASWLSSKIFGMLARMKAI